MYNKILIIGSCGAGKSTLARSLHEATGLPVVHLDTLHWLPGWTERTKEEFLSLLREELEKPSWIIDGNYSGSLPLRLQYCDAVIWLDYSRVTCLWGVVKRIIMNRGRTRPDMGPDCPERFDWDFIKYVWHFDGRKFEPLLAASGKPVFRARNRRALKHIIISHFL